MFVKSYLRQNTVRTSAAVLVAGTHGLVSGTPADVRHLHGLVSGTTRVLRTSRQPLRRTSRKTRTSRKSSPPLARFVVN